MGQGESEMRNRPIKRSHQAMASIISQMLVLIAVMSTCAVWAMDGGDDSTPMATFKSDQDTDEEDSETFAVQKPDTVDFASLPEIILVHVEVETDHKGYAPVYRTLISKNKLSPTKDKIKLRTNLDIDINKLPDKFKIKITIYGGPTALNILLPLKKSDVVPLMESPDESYQMPFDCGVFSLLIKGLPDKKGVIEEASEDLPKHHVHHSCLDFSSIGDVLGKLFCCGSSAVADKDG